MKLTVNKPVEIVASHIIVNVPIRYGTEDIPADAPFRRPWKQGDTGEPTSPNRKYDRWSVAVEIDTGKVCDWPQGKTLNVDMKVCDEGNYTLAHIVDNEPVIGFKASMLAAIKENYVPGCIPGRYGDYIEFDIDENGIVKDWHQHCDADEVRAAFFPESE